jgi:hypothetical protein
MLVMASSVRDWGSCEAPTAEEQQNEVANIAMQAAIKMIRMWIPPIHSSRRLTARLFSMSHIIF